MRLALLAPLVISACSFPGSSNEVNGDARGAEGNSGEAGGSSEAGVPADWWDTSWFYRRRVHVDNGTITTNLNGFPALVPLDPTFAFGHAKPDGSDLRFVTDDGTVLPSELDTFGGAGSALWVRVPVIDAMPQPAPAFWLYYGNPGPATRQSDPTAVWADDVSVHHMTDGADATGFGHTGTAVAPQTTPGPMPGKIGGALSFNGNRDSLTLASTTTGGFNLATSLTVSLWLQAPQFTFDFVAILCKGDHTWRLQSSDNGDRHRPDFATTRPISNLNNDDLVGGTALDDNTWHHLAVTFSNTTKAIYVDGVLDGMDTYNDTIHTTTDAVVVGENDSVNPTRNFHGLLDEVRITAMPRTRDWINAEFRTVTQSDFVTLDPEVSQ